MKKILVLTVLLIGAAFITTTKLGAKMNTNDVSNVELNQTNNSTQVNEVRAKHILVDTKEEADSIKLQIENNKITFEDAAKKYSKCPSKANGGDLGYFGRRMMVKEFEQAAFDAKVNTVTEPVKTQFGWHLIEVIDKK